MADKIGLKLPYRTKFKALGDRLFKNYIPTQPKKLLIVCRDNYHRLLKYIFGICLSCMLIYLSNV